MTLTQVRQLLVELDMRPSKALGQNFLIDGNLMVEGYLAQPNGTSGVLGITMTGIKAEASLDAKGALTSWHFININSGGAAVDTPYRAGKADCRFVRADAPLRQGSYRTLAATAIGTIGAAQVVSFAGTADGRPTTWARCWRIRYRHALHAPYWWLKCFVGHKNDAFLLVKAYRMLLEWDIIRHPPLTAMIERMLNPLLGKSMVFYLKKGYR